MNDPLQYGPYPDELEALVYQLKYRPGWSFDLKPLERDPAGTHGAAAGGLTFVILTGTWTRHQPGITEYQGTWDAYHEKVERPVYHYFVVPAATYNRASWQRWLLDCLLKVETHECMEHFQIDGERPYAPTHGPGDDPYTIHEYSNDERRRTSFRGTVKEQSSAPEPSRGWCGKSLADRKAHDIAVALTPGAD